MPTTAEALKAAWAEGQDVTKELPKFSFEYFPPKTDEGVVNLYNRVYRMAQQKPLFVDLTWGAGGSSADLTMQMSTDWKSMFGVEVNMHLTCTNITTESVKEALVTAKKNGITSIVALRGDPPHGQEKWEASEDGFNCALDLVTFIKKEHGDYFSLSVAGYPEGHPNAITEVEDPSKMSEAEKGRSIITQEGKTLVCTDEAFKKELAYLKQKVDAGADLIITQLFYDVECFLTFVKEVRAMGITVPILPGIMPLANFGGFRRMTGMCKTRIPPSMEAELKPLGDDNVKFKEYGLKKIVEICQQIWASGTVPALHFYCLNQHKTVFTILDKLGITIDPLESDEAKALVDETKEAVQSKLAKDVTEDESSKKQRVV